MALTAAVTLNSGNYSVGQTPPPMANVIVANATAVAISVTGIQILATVLNGSNAQTLPTSPSVPPTGIGQTTVVPANGSIVIGPFPIVFGSAAYVAGANPSVAQPSSATSPANPQGSQAPQFVALIGATVYGSDASINTAVAAPLLVSHGFPPPLGSQGGFANFSAPTNSSALLPVAVL
jgi:uncharacterized membrane protein